MMSRPSSSTRHRGFALKLDLRFSGSNSCVPRPFLREGTCLVFWGVSCWLIFQPLTTRGYILYFSFSNRHWPIIFYSLNHQQKNPKIAPNAWPVVPPLPLVEPPEPSQRFLRGRPGWHRAAECDLWEVRRLRRRDGAPGPRSVEIWLWLNSMHPTEDLSIMEWINEVIFGGPHPPVGWYNWLLVGNKKRSKFDGIWWDLLAAHLGILRMIYPLISGISLGI